MTLQNYIRNKFITIRKSFGLSQDELGKKMGKNGNYVRGMEYGYKEIGVLHVLKFCEVLNLDPNEFYRDYAG